MTNNEILLLMVENATGTDTDSDLDNALKLMGYVKKHPDDFAATCVRDFISAYINRSYADMIGAISDFTRYLANELKIIEEIN